MFNNFLKEKEYPASRMAEVYFPPEFSGKTLNQQFIEDVRTIIRATSCITNPTEKQELLEFCLAALIAQYAEYKIAYLLETNLQKALNHAFNYG